MLRASKWNGKWKRPLCSLVAVLATGPVAMHMAAQTAQPGTLPPTAPTGTVSPSQLSSAYPQAGAVAQQHAEISWDGNALQVMTANVGLNSLLHDIASKANLQITGTAPEERIFGTYGPGKLEDVLSDLLDGVAVNMLFIDRTGSERKQLVLTSRSSGPILPSQGAQNNITNNDPDSAGTSATGPQPNQAFQPIDPNAAARSQGNGSDAPPPTSGVRTPQEIFEQLQRLRAKSASH